VSDEPMQVIKIAMIGLALGMVSVIAHADDKDNLIAKVKTTWRAQDGETAEQIIAKASMVAHFVPRGWEVGEKTDTGEPVVFSWVKHSADKAGDEYSISWEVASDGSMTLGPPYAKPMELGWQAFALSLIASEISEEEEKNPNLRFLHDLSNFNFVTTAQGKLGDLLKRGRCAITNDPVTVDYLPLVDDKYPENGDFWHVQFQVNCDIRGPRYFTREGVVIFTKRPGKEWQGESFFAHRIAKYQPGRWFELSDPKEQETFETARKILQEKGLLGTKP
jgi:hypothetical protein